MSKLREQLADCRDWLISTLYRGNHIHASARLRMKIVLGDLLDDRVGAEYGVGRKEKIDLAARMREVNESIESATSLPGHIILATRILSIPKSVSGDVIECGCFKGASTASLSLVCEMVGRRLLVCDSFEGLPPDDGAVHHYPYRELYGYYEPGMYTGTLEEVRENIRRHGCPSVCDFVPGFFNSTLASVEGPLVFAFLDVDLLSSTEDCVRHLWPKFVDGAYVYSDDAEDMEVVRIWFDEPWWRENLQESAPGFVGSGCGVPVMGGSTLGFARKVSDYVGSYNKIGWLRYPGEAEERADSSKKSEGGGGT
jgi:hypothetical protein